MRQSIRIQVIAGLLIVALSGSNMMGQSADGAPAGLAGRAQSIPASAIFPGDSGQYFEWYEYFGAHRLDGPGEAILAFAIIPFDDQGSGITLVGLDSEGGGTFLALNFEAGLVNGQIPYDRSAWNTVRASLNFGSQSYALSINGAEARNFRFGQPSASIQAFRVDYFGHGNERVLGWFDSVSLKASNSSLLAVDFDGNLPGPQSLCEWCKMEPAEPGDRTVPPCCTNTTRPSTRQEGLAGRAETILDQFTPGQQYFEWYQFFGVRRFDSFRTYDFKLFILPFAAESAGATSVGLDDEDGSTFFSIVFQDGLVNGRLAYVPTDWNAVSASLDFDSQRYNLVLNGAESGALPFAHSSKSVRAFRVNYASPGLKPAVAWFDSVEITSGADSLLSVDFDRAVPGDQNLCEGCRLSAEDPAATGSGSASGSEPRLVIRRSGGDIALWWPSSDPPYILQISESVAGLWRNVNEPVRMEGNWRVMDLKPTRSAAFFRLAPMR